MAMWDNWDNREWQSPEQMRSQAEASRLNALISEEETKINNIYCQIGKLYATVHRDDSEEEFAAMVAEVLESESRIEEYRVQILAVKGLVRCPQCGMELPKGAAFCMACGTPIPKVEEPAQEEYEKCPSCGAMVVKGMCFCTTCGRTMEVQTVAEEAPVEIPAKLACANCGAALEADALFCAECGTSVHAAAAATEEENEICEKPVETPAAEAEDSVRLVCGVCGAVLEYGALFCDQCGVSVMDSAVPYVPEECLWDKAELELDSADEEIPVETAEEPESEVTGGFGVLAAPADLEDDSMDAPAAEVFEEETPASQPEETDAWEEPVAAPALYIVKEELPEEMPEKPRYAPAAGFGVLMAPNDMDDDDMWGEPVAVAPAAEELPEELFVEAPAKPACANCGAELEEGMMFCTECGTPVAKAAASEDAEYETCRSCGATLEKGMKFCTECGTPVEVQAVTASGKRFCLTCGTVLEDGMLFCTECGTRA